MVPMTLKELVGEERLGNIARTESVRGRFLKRSKILSGAVHGN